MFQALPQRGLLPDVVTYSAVVNACEKGHQPGRALEVFQAMQRQSVVMDVITYTVLISACQKGRHLEKALEL